MNILIVGRGRVGSALRRCLEADGDHRITVRGRGVSPSAVGSADVIVLAVPDDAIRDVAAAISPSLEARACVLHCAGARDVEELSTCRARGAATGVMHPLVSFPSRQCSPSLQGATFTIRGSRRALAASRKIAAACGARAVVAGTGNPAYHAAAALTANGAAALAFASVGVLRYLGFERRAAERAIGGLLQSVGDNVQRLGVPEALTGPIARGEATTVAAHRNALRHVGGDALRAYDSVLPVIVRCARAAGLAKAEADRILGLAKR